jgi:LEA14-like dessication related protein
MRHRSRLTAATLLAPLLLVGLSACQSMRDALAAADRPTARITGASLADLSLDAADLLLDVEVANPYGVALPTPTFDYRLTTDDAQLLEGRYTAEGPIEANGRRTLRVPVGIVFADLLRAGRGVKLGDVLPYRADVTLSTTAPGIGEVALPLSRSGELPIPAPPTIALAGIDIDNLSLTSADLTVHADVTNPNAFRLALSTLNYDLALAGRTIASAASADAPALRSGQAGSFAFPISLRPIDLGTAVLGVLRGASADYRLTGAFAADSPFGPIALPVDRAGTVPLTR